nr:1-(5-phosphoribosyl)-5-[(5-phosphoribosylamino)methylideneamino] imidazole-4-carboxamide isomerase [uncultured Olsenella sp.]
MILFPAIDLVGGRVVRLQRGERSRMDVYSDDPVAVACDFAARGAHWVHVVDLSAAFQEDEAAREANRRAIESICGVEGIRVDAGGGVRSLADLERLASAGASRVALGTALVRDPDFARQAARDFGGLVVADVAARDGMVRVNGWRDGAGMPLDALLAELADLGYRRLVLTDVARDGMQTGIDVGLYRHAAELVGFPVVASGGIAGLDDLRALADAGGDVVEGAIVGRALYEGSFTLEEALAVACPGPSRQNEDGGPAC